MILVKDVMTTHLITLKPSDTVYLAVHKMEEGFIRHIPIVDEANRLVGLVTQRDVLTSSKAGPANLVTEIMRTQVVSVTPETQLSTAAAIMIEHKYGCLMVLNPEGALVGILTETDFVKMAITPPKKIS